MKITFNKIFLLFFLVALSGLSWWSYKILRRQYFGSSNSSTTQTSQSNSSQNPNDSANDNPFKENSQDNSPSPAQLDLGPNAPSDGAQQSAKDQSSSHVNLNDRNPGKGPELAQITTEHCATNCQAFASDLQLLEYCQQVCGIIPVKPVSNCDNKKDLEKDYCLKDLAVTKGDSSLCGQINDVNVKQTCQNRIAEDLIENQ